MDVIAPDCRNADATAAPIRPVEGRGGFCVVESAVWRAILAHAKSARSTEVGGIVLGSVCRDDAGELYVLVDGHVPALAATSASASVTFTADAWASIHAHIDRERPGAAIVGWYHTHPNFGIFLSEMDLFIQRHFFDAPHHVAIVIDPVRDESGAFVWRAGTCVKEAIYVEETSPATAAPVPADTIRAKPVAIALSIAAAIVAAALMFRGR